jgi:hypothetical protein
MSKKTAIGDIVTRRFTHAKARGETPDDALPPWYPEVCQAYDLNDPDHVRMLPVGIQEHVEFTKYVGSPNTLLLGEMNPLGAAEQTAYIIPTELFHIEYEWL